MQREKFVSKTLQEQQHCVAHRSFPIRWYPIVIRSLLFMFHKACLRALEKNAFFRLKFRQTQSYTIHIPVCQTWLSRKLMGLFYEYDGIIVLCVMLFCCFHKYANVLLQSICRQLENHTQTMCARRICPVSAQEMCNFRSGMPLKHANCSTICL